MAMAEQGKTYAQVLNGKCHWIFTADELPEWSSNHIEVVDVSGDIPSVGDEWNGTSFVSKTLEEIISAKIKALEAKVQEYLDARARTMNFDNIISGIINASLPLGEYRQADGVALLLWRARTWQKAAEIRDAYLAGTRPEPTWAEVEAELPDYPII